MTHLPYIRLSRSVGVDQLDRIIGGTKMSVGKHTPENTLFNCHFIFHASHSFRKLFKILAVRKCKKGNDICHYKCFVKFVYICFCEVIIYCLVCFTVWSITEFIPLTYRYVI